jgi:pimeloyl-ACP methyl ester carboxylesterase
VDGYFSDEIATMKKNEITWLLILALWAAAPHAASSQVAPTPVTPAPAAPPRMGVVIVVSGVCDDTDISDNLPQILFDRKLPLAIHTIRWCRWGVPGKDHKDSDARAKAASRLANYVKNYRALCPREKIYLIGHSDGTHIILSATDSLPANSVDRIVFMASTVSYSYDLRQALRCSRGGSDAIFSKQDNVVTNCIDHFGTADGRSVQAAGESGFAILPPAHPDAGLYRKLRQYCWDECMAWTGHRGGHNDFQCIGFLDAYVVPLMLSGDGLLK